MTEQELAQAVSGRTPDEFLAHWRAAGEMTEAIGIEALIADHEVESAISDRKFQIWRILTPHMKAGATNWRQLHDALSSEEHEQIQGLLSLSYKSHPASRDGTLGRSTSSHLK